MRKHQWHLFCAISTYWQFILDFGDFFCRKESRIGDARKIRFSTEVSFFFETLAPQGPTRPRAELFWFISRSLQCGNPSFLALWVTACDALVFLRCRSKHANLAWGILRRKFKAFPILRWCHIFYFRVRTFIEGFHELGQWAARFGCQLLLKAQRLLPRIPSLLSQ